MKLKRFLFTTLVLTFVFSLCFFNFSNAWQDDSSHEVEVNSPSAPTLALYWASLKGGSQSENGCDTDSCNQPPATEDCDQPEPDPDPEPDPEPAPQITINVYNIYIINGDINADNNSNVNIGNRDVQNNNQPSDLPPSDPPPSDD